MRTPFIARLNGQAPAANNHYTLLEPVKPGNVLLIRWAAVYNASAEAIAAHFILMIDGSERVIEPEYSVASPKGQQMASQFIWVREGEQFGVRIYSGGAADDYTLLVSGWLYDDEPEVIVVAQPTPAAG